MKKKKLIIAAALAAAISLTVIIVVFAGGSKKDGNKIQNVSVAAVKEPKASSEKESTKNTLLAENEEAEGKETGETADGESHSKEEETSKGADNATDAAPATTNADKKEANAEDQTVQQTQKNSRTAVRTNEPNTATAVQAQPQNPTQPATQKATQAQAPTTAPTTAPAPKPTEPATTAHTHSWQAHYATRTIKEAWDEPVYCEYDVTEMHFIHTCNGNHKNGCDLTEAYNRYVADHPNATWDDFCDMQMGYVTPCVTDPIFGPVYPGNTWISQPVVVGKDKIQVNTIHHEAETEQYIDYYTCACGATK